MAQYVIQGSTLTAIADAIREKGKIYDNLTPAQMPSYINNNLLSTGDVDCILDRTIAEISNTTVQQLGNYAFADCVNLETVYLPEVNSVGKSAFYNCKPKIVTLGVTAINTVKDKIDDVSVMLNSNTNLEELYLPNCVSLYSSAVSGATNLRIVELPVVDTLTKLAFYKCTSLTKIDFPNCGATTKYGVGEQAFDGCTALKEVYLPQIKSMNAFAFRDCPIEIFSAPMLAGQHKSNPFTRVTTFKSVTTGHATIPAWSAHWKNLEYYSNSVATSVDDAAFYGCSLLTENGFYVPNLSVATSSSAFRGTGFIEITPEVFPALSGTLGNYTFYDCPNLKSVHLSLITSTGNRVFGNCPNLEYVKLDNITTMHTNASYPAFVNCTSLKEVHLPAYSGNIVANWLNGLTALEVVDIPLAKVITANAFKGCTALSKVSFPNLTTVQANAFSGCTSLEEVEIGTKEVATALTLSTNAFLNCASLKELTIYYSSVATLANASTIFNGTGITSTTGSIYVPADLLNSYKTATNWSNYKNRIFPYDGTVFSIRGMRQKVIGAGKKTWTDWQNTSNYTNNANYYYTASIYSAQWPRYIIYYYSTPNHTGAMMPSPTSLFRYPKRVQAGYYSGYSTVTLTTPLYQTSIPGTFSFIGYTGKVLSFGLIERSNPDGTTITYHGASTINDGKSYISYLKFADSTAVITPGYDYQIGTIMSQI